MGSRGSEDDKFRHPGHLVEKPMRSGDATGAPTYEKEDTRRYERELAYRAWLYLAEHEPKDLLPDWVAEYLREVSRRLLGSLGAKGALSAAAAHAAINMVGEQWPDHHEEKVHMIMRRWMEDDGMTRKAAAVRYIEEYMGGDKQVSHEFAVNKYKKGQKAAKNGGS